MKLRFPLILIASLFMWLACGRAPEDSRVLVSGGTAADTSANSVVRIATQGKSFCTGVLVASDLIITAAHCIGTLDKSQITVVFPLAGTDKTRSASGLQKLRNDSLLYFPNFDIAWIRLSSAAPSPYKPAAILGNSRDVTVGTGMNLLGASNDTPCSPGDSTCNLVQIAIKLKSSWSSSHLVNLAVVESSQAGANSGTCPGDSGGPTFISRGGQFLLYGIVAGKDPIFTGGGNNACGSPTSVLTRIGEYQNWIETTSGSRLTVVEPAQAMLSLEFLTGTGTSGSFSTWQDWFNKPLASQASWTTVHKLLEQTVLEFQGQIPNDQIPTLFQGGGQNWIEKLTILRSLSLGFPDQSVALTDLRPLEGLKNLEDLTFLTRSYQGLETLAKLKKLKSISVQGRTTISADQGNLAWNELASTSLETIKISKVAYPQFQAINWSRMPALKFIGITLPTGKIPSSAFNQTKLSSLETLQVQEFSCDQSMWPSSPMVTLKSLNLRSTLSLAQSDVSCINWQNLPQLKEIVIQGYTLDVNAFTANMPETLAAQIRATH